MCVCVYYGAEECSLYIVAQVVKCSHSNEDQSMIKCLWKLVEFFRCPVDHLLHSFSCYFAFQVRRMMFSEFYTESLILMSLQVLHWINFPEMTENSKSFHELSKTIRALKHIIREKSTIINIHIICKFVHIKTWSYQKSEIYNCVAIYYISCVLCVRVILIWNRLPAALVQENNLPVFKSMLWTFDFSYTLLGKL